MALTAPNPFPLTAITCAENIALLNLLHRVPIPPSAQPKNSYPHWTSGSSLSVEEERSLVGILAFLSCVKDDPDHVPAVCVRQYPGSGSLDVLIAVNKIDVGDGDQILQTSKEGFEGIFAVLSQVGIEANTENTKHDVLAAVVSMCSERILCRLRLVQNELNPKRQKKQPIKEILQIITKYINNTKRGKAKNLAPSATLFVERAKRVIILMDSWVNHQIQARLMELVKGIYQLRQVKGLSDLLNAIPNTVIAPTSRTSLLNIVRKVARYWEAGRFLFHTARKTPCVRQMKATVVTLPQEAFRRGPSDEYTPELQRTVSRIAVPRRFKLNNICRLLGLSTQAASDDFAQQAQRTLTEAKIHAEIQLLYFCAEEPSMLPPRVICSSKDACFLCNTFILAYGKVHIPRSHGRLYPGWRLPCVPTFEHIEQRFNQALEKQIRISLENLTQKQKRTMYPIPNESTLLTLGPSMSTIHTLLETAVTKTEKELERPMNLNQAQSQNVTLNLNPPSDSPPAPPPEEYTDDIMADAELNIMSKSFEESISKTGRSTEVRSSYPSLTSSRGSSFELSQGYIVSGSLRNGQKPKCLDAGPLRVHIHPSTNSQTIVAESTVSELGYDLKWLSDREVEEHPVASIVDTKALKGDVVHELDDSDCLYLSYCGVVVKLCLRLKLPLTETADIPVVGKKNLMHFL